MSFTGAFFFGRSWFETLLASWIFFLDWDSLLFWVASLSGFAVVGVLSVFLRSVGFGSEGFVGVCLEVLFFPGFMSVRTTLSSRVLGDLDL